MKAYKVYCCRIEGGKSWSGTVIDTEGKGVSEAIKKKFGLKYLYCEKYLNNKLQDKEGKQFDFRETPLETVSLNELTVGELLGILRHNIEVDKMAVVEARKTK